MDKLFQGLHDFIINETWMFAKTEEKGVRVKLYTFMLQ